MKLYDKTAHELGIMLNRREITSQDITQDISARIKQHDDKIKAYLSVMSEKSLEDAINADKMICDKKGVRVTGIPIAIKDIICVKGHKCTCGSKILENFIAPYDATVIERLKKAGSVITGKTNLDEFAMGSSTENSAYFTTKNPWNIERVPGGSSGGSAAAVAAGEAIWALGSDTGGSVRQPAAFCGITGLKPTYGLVSRYGLVAYASSLDQIGIFTKDVKDCAILLGAIAGRDERDSTSADVHIPDYFNNLSENKKRPRIGIVKEFFSKSLDRGISELIKKAAEKLESIGFPLVEVSLPNIEYSLPAYYIIAPAEASSNLARYDGARYGLREAASDDIISMFKETRKKGFAREVKRRIMLGTYTLSSGYYDAYYLRAQKVRTLIKKDFSNCFKECDVIMGPVTPTTAFKIGENIDDPLKMYLSDIYTVSINLAGLPALAIPCGFSDGLPVGFQLIGKAFDEDALLSIGHAFQSETDFHLKRPPMFYD